MAKVVIAIVLVIPSNTKRIPDGGRLHLRFVCEGSRGRYVANQI